MLTGACISRAGLNRKTALATATLTLAAEAPDIDVIGRFKGPVFGFAHHRGFTHSFLGLILVSAAVVSLMYLIWRLRGRKIKDPGLPPRWDLLFVYSYLAGLSHILLDFTNNYGVRPFWPFSEKWYSWDIVFIVDPIILGILTAGLVLPGLFSLVNSEIGARWKHPQGRIGAAVALSAIVLLWGVRDFGHRRAVAALEGRVYENANPIRASAYPYWFNSPFHWNGVVETKDFFALAPVDSITAEVDPGGQMQVRYKPEETAITRAAKSTYLGRVYLDWAQYPVTETEQLFPSQSGYLVRFHDLRYDSLRRIGSPRRSTLGATVELDSNLRIVSESFGAGGSKAAEAKKK